MRTCAAGPARLRPHTSVLTALAEVLRAARGNVDVERALPSVRVTSGVGVLEEAVMDVTAWWPGDAAWYAVDVTIRHPGAARYGAAGRRAGVAAQMAEREKHRRYGPEVIPLAFESGGRLGDEGAAGLEQLAAVAAASECITTSRGLVTRWRQRLEAALLFALVDATLLALGGRCAEEGAGA